jgi:hypothetical protein
MTDRRTINDVLANEGSMGLADITYALRALADATADGPLTADVVCPRCQGGAIVVPLRDAAHWCPVCDGSCTVRLVIHRADTALADQLRVIPSDDAKYAAAALIDGSDR